MRFHMLAKCIGISSCLYLLHTSEAKAQNALASTDTLRLNLKQTESLFFEKNLELIAQHYHVASDQALTEQARLWDNPELVTDQNVYTNNRFFEHKTNIDGSYNGQYYFQLQQLIKTAGKRGKEIKLSQTNAAISDWQLKDLLRNLKLQLRSDFYTIAQLLRVHQLYEKELEQLNKLLQVMSTQYNMGNIAYKDLLRIQALQIGTQQDLIENTNQLNELQAELKTLLQITGNTFILPELTDDSTKEIPEFSFEDLLKRAKENNPAYRLKEFQLIYQQQNLSLQRSLAVPDITVGPNFDKNSSYTPNYVGLGISFPIPFINRNQGNIHSSQWLVKEKEADLLQADNELGNSIISAYNKFLNIKQLNDSAVLEFYSNYERLYDNIVESYQRRQISLIEFIDYFEAYKEIKQKALKQRLNLQLAQEELNYQIGIDVLP